MATSASDAHRRTLARARAASEARTWRDAMPLWEEVVTANPVEGRHWERLAEACHRGGAYGRAIEATERALALGAGYPAEGHYRIACCRALRGEREAALDALDAAFARGYRHSAQARIDPDLAALFGDARFHRIVGLLDTSSLTRDAGWQADLDYLVREIKRLGYAPFRLVSEAEFDARAATLRAAIPRLGDAEIVAGFMRLLRLVDDGHTRLRDFSAQPHLCQTLPVQFSLFEEGLFIVAAAPQHEALLGAQVLAFDGRPTEAVCAALDPLISRDNAQWPKQMLPYHLREVALLHALAQLDAPTGATLTLRDRAGQESTATIAADATQPDIWFAIPSPVGWRFLPETLPGPLPHYLRNAGTFYWFDYLPEERAVYFQFNRVRDAEDEPLAAFTERLFRCIGERPVEKLVIDLRWNNGGNTFLELPLLHRLIACDKVNRWGKLFVIIGRRTFSAAQNGATLIERHTQALFAGEPTGSCPNFVGESIPLVLPYSGIVGTISDLYWQSSWPMDGRTWIAPHLYAPPTFAAYAANRDPALEAVLACREHTPGW